MQGGGQFQAQFRPVKRVAVHQQDVYALTLLPGVIAGAGGKVHGHEAHSGNTPRVQLLRQFLPFDPRRDQQLNRPFGKDPVTGLGRSSTTSSIPALATASRKYPSVVS